MSDQVFTAALGALAGVVLCLLVALGFKAGYNTGKPDETAFTIPSYSLRCPEDADMVVRYGVNPAGTIAFCLASDNIEEVLP